MCNLHHHGVSTGPDGGRCFIIPPHMLEVLTVRGDAGQRAMAREFLMSDEDVRNERSIFAASVPKLDEERSVSGTVSAFVAPAAATAPQLNREIYDGGGLAALPGTLKRAEGDPPTGDADVDDAYDGAGDVYELYYQEFGRDSLDGSGMTLEATVHHRTNYNNAFWNGRQMAYGDGDGTIFTGFTDLSVIGHEMSHGVVQFSGGLVYQDQSGALNESFADVFGALTVQRKLGQEAADANWLIGESILGPGISGEALRNMKAPGTAYSDVLLGQDPQPYHMDLYVNTSKDHGGVHINSGIPNHAFYLYSMYLGGNAWARAGQVWYRALQTLNHPHATFHDWAEETIIAATTLFGTGSTEAIMLKRAWRLVGIAV